MENDKRFNGNPEFPIEEPKNVVLNQTTNDTDIIYVIDTGGVEATFATGMQSIDKDGSKAASVWANKLFTGVLYGRWTNVGANVQLACYEQFLPNSAT